MCSAWRSIVHSCSESFFFQAEDGIRDDLVTGVQTCALPIFQPLCVDWRLRYGYEPVLLESFVEIPRYTGASYRAANWIKLGQTQGRGKLEKNNCQIVPLKEIWVYAVHPAFRDILRAPS